MEAIKNRPWIFFAMVLLVPLSAFSIWQLLNENVRPLPYLGGYKMQGKEKVYHTIPHYAFINQDGEVYSSESANGKISVVNFFFSTCRTICPKMISNMAEVNRAFENDPGVMLVSITVDPEMDTPEALHAYRELYEIKNPQWHFLTGDKKALYRTARNGYFITAAEGDGGSNDFIHSENIVLVDPQGHIRGYYKGTEDREVKRLIKDISRLKKE